MNPYPDAQSNNSLEDGQEFQDFVMLALQKHGLYLQQFASKKYQYEMGESLQGWEIKLDNTAKTSGRLSIEVAEKSKRSVDEWTPSGIYRPDNTWLYIQGNDEFIYIFMKHFLVQLQAAKKYEVTKHNGTIKRFFLPLSEADKYGYKIIPDIEP